ncbi:MAG: magnesium chelatase subunit H [Gammaproteobacteria bacterium]|nr:magnesium chelatase subunit H [Gammaproteobacteria bacterium]
MGDCKQEHRDRDQADPALAADLASSDVVFISLINMRPQADWLAAQLAGSRASAVFAYESMPEVMALTKVGEHRFKEKKGEAPKAVKLLMRLVTRGRDEDALYAYTKLVKVAAKMLPLIPQKLAGFRTWLGVNLYWNQPDAANITQMVKLILADTCGMSGLAVAPVAVIPTMGCFDPVSGALFDDCGAYLKWAAKQGRYRKGQPLVALLGVRKHVIQRLDYLRQLVAGIESRGMAVLPVFVSGIEAHVAVREWLADQPIDAFVSTMGFSIVGGPASSTKPGHYHETAADLLGKLDVPYLVAQPLLMQEEHEWRARGAHSMQSVVMYDLPEMDGVASAMALGAIRDGELVTAPDRVARALDQIEGWIRLRRKPAAEKRVAIVLYNFPPGLGKAGTAALLDVPASVTALLKRLRSEGYAIGRSPTEVAEFNERVGALERGEGGRSVTVAEFRRWLTGAAERIEKFWGQAPGDIAPAGREAIRIDALECGNIAIGLQPPMGVPGDPMRLLFEKTFTPHHQFAAFYAWLKHGFKADAIIHVGMHGTAEWMPGLQTALTGECWPDQLLGALPHLYLYPLNNPAEAAVARRRGYATIISHAIPPYARAGLYKQLAQARARLEDPQDALDGALPELVRGADEPVPAFRARAAAWLDGIEQRLIVDGQHVFGTAPDRQRSRALVEATLEVPRGGAPGLGAVMTQAGVATGQQRPLRDALVERSIFGREDPSRVWTATLGASASAAPAALAAMVAEGRGVLGGMARCGEELDAVVHALAGGYIRPAYGADPVRAGAAALPSGRNIHGIDPWRLPTDLALERGRRTADILLERHRAANGGAWPRTVAQALWAMDTIKTEGEGLGVVLALVGAEPARDGQGKIFRFDLVPLARLGRPRIDVLLDVSAVFRDTFQMSLDLLDELFRRAALADEPPESNFLRANTDALRAAGRGVEEATARIFTQAPGLYGTGVDELVEENQWEEAGQLADTYERRNAHTAGGKRGGAAAPEVLRGLLGTVDHVFQAIDSVEYGLTDMSHYYGHSGALQVAATRARGKGVDLSYAETAGGEPRVSSAGEMLRIEARAKLLNPKWYESMLAHGHGGAAEIGNRFTHLVGWGALGSLDAWVYQDAAQTFVLDDAMRRRLETANPQAARNVIGRLIEAHGRGMWQADEVTLERLQGLYADIEDRLEGVGAAA